MGTGDIQILNALIKAGADVNVRDTQGTTPLIEAVLTGQYDMFRPLLRAGADAQIADNAGRTAMDHARLQCDAHAVRTLFDEQLRERVRASFSATARHDIDDVPRVVIVRRVRIDFGP